MFSVIIRNLRQQKGLTQKELAREVYLSPGAISQYEKGKARPSQETLENLAKYFGVSVSYLLGSSVNADVEQLLSKEFADGVSMSELMKLCSGIPQEHRATFLKITRSLVPSDGANIPHKNEKVCR